MSEELTLDQFIDLIYSNAYLGAVSSEISSFLSPPGRAPRKELVALSRWYLQLGDSDRAMVELAMQHSAFASIFTIFAMLDGASTVVDGGREQLQLNVVDAAGVQRPLDPENEEFHSVFRWKVDQENPDGL